MDMLPEKNSQCSKIFRQKDFLVPNQRLMVGRNPFLDQQGGVPVWAQRRPIGTIHTMRTAEALASPGKLLSSADAFHHFPVGFAAAAKLGQKTGFQQLAGHRIQVALLHAQTQTGINAFRQIRHLFSGHLSRLPRFIFRQWFRQTRFVHDPPHSDEITGEQRFSQRRSFILLQPAPHTTTSEVHESGLGRASVTREQTLVRLPIEVIARIHAG